MRRRAPGNVSITMMPSPRQLRQDLRELKDKIFDLEPVWRKSKATVAASLRRAIKSRGASIGANWKPLSADYAKRVGRRYATLKVTGSLLRAATSGALKIVRNQPITGAVYRISHDVAQPLMRKFPFVAVDDSAVNRIRHETERHVTKQATAFYRKRRGIAAKGLAR